MRRFYTKRKMMDDKPTTYTYQYPHPAVTTDCVVFGFDGYALRVLLIERGCEPFKGRWAFPGGFLKINETAEACAKRELKEETNLDLSNLKQLRVYSDVDRDPRERVITIAFYALVKSTDVEGGDDATKAKWFPVDQVPALAFDHDRILRDSLYQLKKDIHFEPIGFDLLDDTFTIPQLQRLYESILGIQFDRRNFHKKMMQLGLIEQIEEFQTCMSQCRTFGEHSEMRAMDIDALFGAGNEELSCLHANTWSTRGRKPNRFRFNKDKYDELKNDQNFKLEF